MNRYPLWKYLLVLSAVCIGLIYAMPNLYAPDPAVQISGVSLEVPVDEKVLKKVEAVLNEQGIEFIGSELSERSLLIRLTAADDQMRARRQVEEALGSDYLAAVNLAPTTPDWLRSIGAKPMNLGLDLAGGVHFLLEVDTEKVVSDGLDDLERFLKRELREERLRGVNVRAGANKMRITTNDEEKLEKVRSILRKDMPELQYQLSQEEGLFVINAELTEAYISEKEDNAVTQNLITLRKRVNEIGVSEPLVQRQGRNRIVVQLAGIQDASRAKNILGKTANLEFRMEARPEASLAEKEKFPFADEADQRRNGDVYLERNVIVTGRNVLNAQPTFDPQTNEPQVSITLDSEGASRMTKGTFSNVGRRMGTLFIEFKTEKVTSVDKDGNEVVKNIQVPKEEIISYATVRNPLGKNFVITGLDSPQYAAELALLLRAGALAAPMSYVEERTIGPSLGAENIKLGVKSVQLGLSLVLIFMIVFYRAFGVAANIALAANLVLIVAIMSGLGATLTLPGIAGIVLTVGMAVDANVLIFSRIKEELKNGLPNQSAINSGFDRAVTTILDANITTLIVAVILFAIGTGPVKGFAVTLMIGILTSMFTAIMGTRSLINIAVGGRQVKKLWI
jgi:preprotein translocase subunit SecD